MNILIIGSFSHWNSLESHYSKYLSNLSNTVELYPFPDYINKYRTKNIFNRIKYRFKIGIKRFLLKENFKLQNHILKGQYDLIWVFKGLDIFPETIKSISIREIPIINYNPDHPFIRTFKSGGGKEIEDCVPLYNLNLCYSQELINDIHKRYKGTVNTEFLPFGYELSDNLYVTIQNEMNFRSEKVKVCFIGNPDNELRRKTLKYIIEKGIEVDIYGTNWNKFIKKSKNVNIFPGVYGDEYWRTLRNYRIQLNIFRPHNFNSHNMRTFEIPAVGGIQLAPWSTEHILFFQNEEEIILYKNLDELVNKIYEILSYDSEKANQIRQKSRQRCITSRYSYRERTLDLIKVFQNLTKTFL